MFSLLGRCHGEWGAAKNTFVPVSSAKSAWPESSLLCSRHIVKAYVERRAAGGLNDKLAARAQLIDEYLPKVEEWVERSGGKVRADVAHEKLLALGYAGSERTTRRAVAKVKSAYRAGRVRVHRPWVTEPGMWLQYDYGDGPVIDGAKTVLFVAWLAWST